MTDVSRRTCAWCPGPILETARRDAITCSKPCRQARHRMMRHAAEGLDVSRTARGMRDASRAAEGDVSTRLARRRQASRSAGVTRRLAYADPPYPGRARRYYGDHPDYAGEVDHAALLSRMATYDGWALSTGADSLPDVLALAVAQGLPVRVAAWTRPPRPARTRYPLNSWEPVVYVPVARRPGDGRRRLDTFSWGVKPLSTLPGRVIGAKPPAFCRWVFDLIGAGEHDTFDDLFPGSGIVGKTWDAYAAALRDVSLSAAAQGDT